MGAPPSSGATQEMVVSLSLVGAAITAGKVAQVMSIEAEELDQPLIFLE
jgi:hypothetical protein